MAQKRKTVKYNPIVDPRAPVNIVIDEIQYKWMREIARRKRTERRMLQSGFFYEAIREYVHAQRVPKRKLKVNRKQVQLLNPTEAERKLLNDCKKIAYIREQPLSIIIEEALKRYIDKPENYLGKSVYEREKYRYEDLD